MGQREWHLAFACVAKHLQGSVRRPTNGRAKQIIFKGTDPYEPESWSNAVHFNFTGYDPEPFWDDDGKVYITAAHAWQVG